jgi:hypothetical protein
MAFGTFVIPDFSGAFYQNSLLVQAQGQLVLTAYIVSQITHFVNDVLFVGELLVNSPVGIQLM